MSLAIITSSTRLVYTRAVNNIFKRHKKNNRGTS